MELYVHVHEDIIGYNATKNNTKFKVIFFFLVKGEIPCESTNSPVVGLHSLLPVGKRTIHFDATWTE